MNRKKAIKRARASRDHFEMAYGRSTETVRRMARELYDLRQERDVLRKALEPFASIYSESDEFKSLKLGGGWVIYDGESGTITVEELATAQAALDFIPNINRRKQ